MPRFSLSSVWLAAAMLLAGPQPVAAESPPAEVSVHFLARAPVPFELVRGALFFKAVVKGRDAWATLDNGASESLLDRAFALNAGLALGEPNGELSTPTAKISKRSVTDVPILIPGAIEFTAPLSAVDLAPFSSALGRKIEFVLGREYLSKLELLVASGAGEFMLGPTGSLVPPRTVSPDRAYRQAGESPRGHRRSNHDADDRYGVHRRHHSEPSRLEADFIDEFRDRTKRNDCQR